MESICFLAELAETQQAGDVRALVDYVFNVLATRGVHAVVPIVVNGKTYIFRHAGVTTAPERQSTTYTGPSMISALERVADDAGTPFYAYSAEAIDSNLTRLRAMLPEGARIFFALMANDNPRILGLLHDTRTGMFAGSDQNLVTIAKAGVAKHGVIFAPAAFTVRSYEFGRSFGSQELVFFANSLSQYRQAVSEIPDVPIGLRLRVTGPAGSERTLDAHKDATAQRLGIEETEVRRALSDAATRKSVAGLHVYPGTNLRSPSELLSAYAALLEFSELLDPSAFLDFGGGLPSIADVPLEEPYWHEWRTGVRNLVAAHTLGSTKRLLFELGRTLVADAGVFVTTVLEVRRLPDDRRLVLCDTSVGAWPRPHRYESTSDDHAGTVLGRTGPSEGPCVLTGCTTYSADLLLAGAELPRVEAGDRIVLSNAGAYCATLSSRFLGVTRPREWLVTGSSVEDISFTG